MTKPKRRRVLTVEEMARLGGKARWADVSSEKRSEIARKAVQARWARAKARKAERNDDSPR
jgi:hypothetical protein